MLYRGRWGDPPPRCARPRHRPCRCPHCWWGPARPGAPAGTPWVLPTSAAAPRPAEPTCEVCHFTILWTCPPPSYCFQAIVGLLIDVSSCIIAFVDNPLYPHSRLCKYSSSFSKVPVATHRPKQTLYEYPPYFSIQAHVLRWTYLLCPREPRSTSLYFPREPRSP